MLKRHQVLLEDWQVEYLQAVAEAHDISVSEALRVIFSMGTICAVEAIHPEYKSGVPFPEIAKMMKKTNQLPYSMDYVHKFISTIYFEARKAVEFRMPKLKRLDKKNGS
jgi:hypothetical protein